VLGGLGTNFRSRVHALNTVLTARFNWEDATKEPPPLEGTALLLLLSILSRSPHNRAVMGRW